MYQTHGHYSGGKASPTYGSWQNMRTRCLNSNDPSYKDYGAKGVTICKRWDRFENFIADMGERPVGHTLDRRNGSQGYSKRNCRWATFKQQAHNRSTTVPITFKGETHCLAEWARRLGHNLGVLRGRLRRGFSIKDALETASCGATYRRTRVK